MGVVARAKSTKGSPSRRKRAPSEDDAPESEAPESATDERDEDGEEAVEVEGEVVDAEVVDAEAPDHGLDEVQIEPQCSHTSDCDVALRR